MSFNIEVRMPKRVSVESDYAQTVDLDREVGSLFRTVTPGNKNKFMLPPGESWRLEFEVPPEIMNHHLFDTLPREVTLSVFTDGLAREHGIELKGNQISKVGGSSAQTLTLTNTNKSRCVRFKEGDLLGMVTIQL